MPISNPSLINNLRLETEHRKRGDNADAVSLEGVVLRRDVATGIRSHPQIQYLSDGFEPLNQTLA